MTIEIAVLTAIISALVGIAGWVSGHDKKVSTDSEWKGSLDAKISNLQNTVDAKLSSIQNTVDVRLCNLQSGVDGINERMDKMENKVDKQGRRITIIETTMGLNIKDEDVK